MKGCGYTFVHKGKLTPQYMYFTRGNNTLDMPLHWVGLPQFLGVSLNHLNSRAVAEHNKIVRNMMSYYGNTSAMMFEYNIGVNGPKSFRGYSAKMDDK